jgi:hypothetical protein
MARTYYYIYSVYLITSYQANVKMLQQAVLRASNMECYSTTDARKRKRLRDLILRSGSLGLTLRMNSRELK